MGQVVYQAVRDFSARIPPLSTPWTVPVFSAAEPFPLVAATCAEADASCAGATALIEFSANFPRFHCYMSATFSAL